MTTLTSSGLKIPDDYGDADWEVYDAFNWARLNDVLLKLSALLDVDISGRADGDVLAWDTAAGKWKPKPPVPMTTTTSTTTTSTSTTSTSSTTSMSTTTSTTSTISTSTTTTAPPGTWLSGWSKRIKVTIDNTNIDSDLSHFPLPIVLGASVGQDNDDVSAVFDEVGSNYKKIAVTQSDGVTQLYIEVEKWDATAEKALLWASKSGWAISSSGTTDIYLYYDNTHADNTTYVGEAGDSAAQNVWLPACKASCRLHADCDDSTSNGNNGTGSGISYVSGTLANGINIDLGEYVDFGNISDLKPTAALSIGIWFSCDNYDSSIWPRIFDFKERDGGPTKGYGCWLASGGRISFVVNGTATGLSNAVSDSGWHRLYCTYSKTDGVLTVYLDGAEITSASLSADIDYTGCDRFNLGNYNNNASSVTRYDGRLDQFEFYEQALSAAWIKADYYAQTDNLLTFGPEENLSTTTTTTTTTTTSTTTTTI